MFQKNSKPGSFCPFVKGECVQHKCALYIMVRGTNPQTGAEVDDWGCSLAFMPVLMVENSQQQRQTGAAVESFRNEVVEANKRDVLLRQAEMLRAPGEHLKLIGGD